MSSFTVRRLASREYPGWNDFVVNQRTGTLFQTVRWLVHFPKGHLEVWGCYDAGRLVGGFAFRRHAIFGVNRIIAPPLTPYYGPVWHDDLEEETHQHLNRLLLETIDPYDALQITPPVSSEFPDFPDSSRWIKYFHPTYIMEPGRDDEELLNYYPKQTRYEVRRARRDGLVVQHQIPIDTVRDLAERSLRHAGRKFPVSASRFSHFCSELLGQSCLYTLGVKSGHEQYDAALMLVTDPHSAYNILFGIDRENGHRNAGTLLMHEALCRASQQGLILDFEGSSIEGVRKFYEKFGPVRKELATCTHARTLRIRLLQQLGQYFGRRFY